MIVTELARFAHNLRFEQLPEEVVEKAKTCILDLMGVSVCSYGHANSVVAVDGITPCQTSCRLNHAANG